MQPAQLHPQILFDPEYPLTLNQEDQFLHNIGLYRKHSLTTCLFDVIAEQEIWGIPCDNATLRYFCVQFMRKNENLFARDINCNYQSYLENMALPNTYGTTLELKALAMCYNANVIMFKPFDFGTWFMLSENPTTTWRLFSEGNNHFNTVFTYEYMRYQAQMTQQMLHEQQERQAQYLRDQMLHQQQQEQSEIHIQRHDQVQLQQLHSNWTTLQRMPGMHIDSAHQQLNQQAMGSVAGVAGLSAQWGTYHHHPRL